MVSAMLSKDYHHRPDCAKALMHQFISKHAPKLPVGVIALTSALQNSFFACGKRS